MSDMKTKPTRRSVPRFIRAIDHPRRRADCEALLPLFKRVTGRDPVLWGDKIVGYGAYHYKYASGREGDWPITGFSPGKQQLTLYVMPGFSNYGQLLDKLGKYRTGKSCLYITRLENVDMAVLEQLLRRAVADMRKSWPCT